MMDDILLQVASHPLNSINPPPQDLPDLLDSLLSSHTQVKNKINLCDRMVSSLSAQTGKVDRRLKWFISSDPDQSVSFVGSYNEKDAHRAHRQEIELLHLMIEQLTFISWKFGDVFKQQLERLTTAHFHVFTEFLGYLHDHAEHDPGAKPEKLGCFDGCNWYQTIGGYEWSKRPYTNSWWQKMNNTDWDWIRVREHIRNMVVEGRKATMNIEMFHSNVKKFVPAWIWYDDPWMWALRAIVSPAKNGGEDNQAEIKVQVTFVKNDKMKREERLDLEQKQRVQWILEGMSPDEAEARSVKVEVSMAGMQDMNCKAVFDGSAIAPDWTRGGYTPIGSWLDWWGFGKWLNPHRKVDVGLQS